MIGDAGNDVFIGTTLDQNVATDDLAGAGILDVLTQAFSTTEELATDISGADSMLGGAGDDFFLTGAGDTVIGGQGQDWFVAHAGQDSPTVIHDFNPSDTLVITFDGGNGLPSPGIYYDSDENPYIAADGNTVFRFTSESNGLSYDNILFYDRSDPESGLQRFEHISPFVGGSGDDTISAAAGNRISGGDGDDQLQLTERTFYDIYVGSGDPAVLFGGGSLDGNAGDDTLSIEIDRFQDTNGRAFTNSTQFTGGDGNDTFRLAFEYDNLGEYLFNRDDQIIEITDYNPDEDTIVLETNRDMGEISIAVQENGDALILIGETQAILVVGGGETLTIDDIQFIDTSEESST
ncbi:hypothetical protein NBRC116601_10470 [Cognatishimia sp. WU-CL00825]